MAQSKKKRRSKKAEGSAAEARTAPPLPRFTVVGPATPTEEEIDVVFDLLMLLRKRKKAEEKAEQAEAERKAAAPSQQTLGRLAVEASAAGDAPAPKEETSGDEMGRRERREKVRRHLSRLLEQGYYGSSATPDLAPIPHSQATNSSFPKTLKQQPPSA